MQRVGILFSILCNFLVFSSSVPDRNFQNNHKTDDLIVQLPEGKIQGHILKSFNGADYYAFQEVPYAAPPIGKNRFKEPKYPDHWKGILNTTANTKSCTQDDTYRFGNATEDCLYLNVYTPQKLRSNPASLPVFVWIHGGGYAIGSGAHAQANPGFVMDYNIILVTINYRLGPFGFLSTMDGVIPSNLGLKDQRHALRWVKKNIRCFGGDPNKVTIGGESSGAASVAFHLLSQNSEGAIQQSETAMARIVYTDKAKQFAFELGNILDKSITKQSSSAQLLNLLQKSSASDILAAGLQVQDLEDKSLGYLPAITWAPVVECNNESNDPFVTKLMYESYINGDFQRVPLLTGFNSEEILLFINGTVCPFGESYDSDPSIMINRKLNIPVEKRREAGTLLKNIYTNTSFANDIAACAIYSSDVSFQNPIVRHAETASKFVPVYLYRFSYVGRLGDLWYEQGRPVIPGTETVGHGEDLSYLWQYVTNVTVADQLTVRRFQTLWSNFIKYLNPTPKKDELLQNVIWPRVHEHNIQFFNFNNTLEVMSNLRYYEQVKALFQKYQQPPFVTWNDDVIVELPEGKIRGHILKSYNRNDYYAFQEIPYAAAPVGENRFKEPKNPSRWDGILNTTKNTKICMQNKINALNKTEDCLYLNVYTPQKLFGKIKLLPVLVWIHGGGYAVGSGAFFQNGPTWLMDFGIVVVTINYRLGPLGFLTTMDGIIPANLGLKDQRHALRWINKNIRLFGGDPAKVTIGGESAGSFSVSFHLLDQKSRGLFRAAIQESGTAMTQLCYTDKAKSYAFQLGNILDNSVNEQNSTEELLEVLQKASASEIITAGNQVSDEEKYPFGYLYSLLWSPVIESSTFTDPIVTTHMYDAFTNGDFNRIPTLIGFNSEEILSFINGRDCFFGDLYALEPSTMVGRKLNIANQTVVGNKLTKIYTNTSFSNNTAACVKYSSDVNFVNPITRQAECTSQFAPTYLYQFSYLGDLAVSVFFPDGRPMIPGTESVGHQEELAYLWKYEKSMNISTISDSDLLTVQRLQTLWTNFVKTLNPTPGPDPLLQNIMWPKITKDTGSIQYLNINNTLEVRKNPRYYKQVKDIYEMYQQPPFVTW